MRHSVPRTRTSGSPGRTRIAESGVPTPEGPERGGTPRVTFDARALPVESRASWSARRTVCILFTAATLSSLLSCTAPLEGRLSDTSDANDPIESYLSRTVPDSATVRVALEGIEKAGELAKEEKWEEALATLEASLSELPTIEDWKPILLAEMRAMSGDTAGVRAELERAADSDGSRRMVDRWGWLLSVDAHEKAGDLEKAARLAESQAERSMPEADGSAPDRDLVARAWLRTGELALAARDSARARHAFLRTVETFPRSGHALQAARHFDSFRDLTSHERYRVGRTWHAHGNWERAHDGLSHRLTQPGLSAEERHALRFDLGRALFQLGRYADAEKHLRPLTEDSVSVEVAAEALFWSGRSQYRQGRQIEGRATLERVAERYPRDRHAAEALLLLADLEEGAGRVREARALLERAFENGVRNAETDLRAVRMGSSAYLAGEYRFAAESFDRYFNGSGRNVSRQQSAFWAALAHDRLGNEVEVEERLREVYEIDPLSYYGAQAADRLRLEVLPRNLPDGPPGSPPSSLEVMEPRMRNALLRLAVHQRVPLAGSFAFEFERQRQHFIREEDRGYGFAEALIANGFEIQGILMGRDFHREEGEWNLRMLRIVYPFPYRETIVREARARGLDPFFVAGLIRQESMFRPDIQSPAGAVGLMQIMPATGRQLAPRAGVSSFSNALLEDPEINIRMGTDFLATMLTRFDDRIPDALSAYNAGPTRIRRWRNLPEYGDPNVFVEHIPFRETRNYVKVVQQNTRIYAALYGCEGFTSCRGMSYRSISEQGSTERGSARGAEERDTDHPGTR